MRKSSVASATYHPRILGSHIKRGKNINVNNDKLKTFCTLWSVGTPKNDIMTKLKIKKVQYYNYIDAAEEIVDDFLLGFVDHGLVLLFRDRLEATQRRAEALSRIAEKYIQKVEDSAAPTPQDIKTMTQVSRAADATGKLYNEMLDDSKIVNQTMKTINRVMVKSSQVKAKRED